MNPKSRQQMFNMQFFHIVGLQIWFLNLHVFYKNSVEIIYKKLI